MLGIFDSGIGGLSVLRKIKEKNFRTDIVYFGDVKNAPYGEKSQTELKDLTSKGIKTLLKNGATNILSACNSISIFMLLSDESNFGIMEMISPTVSKYSKFQDKKIVIFATPATIQSEIYQKKFLEKGIKIKAIPIKKLAGAIEFGLRKNEIETIVNEAIEKIDKHKTDKIILCCTHYPLVAGIFKIALEKIDRNIGLIDPAGIVAEKTLEKFREENGSGKLIFLISQESQVFRKTVKKYFGKFNYEIRVV